MPLDTEVGLAPGNIVLMDTQLLDPKRGTAAPTFGPCLFWPNGWMDQDATWYMEVSLGPGHIVLDGDPVPPKMGQSTPISVHVYCGQTVARLSNFSF